MNLYAKVNNYTKIIIEKPDNNTIYLTIPFFTNAKVYYINIKGFSTKNVMNFEYEDNKLELKNTDYPMRVEDMFCGTTKSIKYKIKKNKYIKIYNSAFSKETLIECNIYTELIAFNDPEKFNRIELLV